MEVSEGMIDWLKQNNSIQYPVSIENEKFYINELDAEAFEYGLNIVPLVTKLYKLLNPQETPLPEISSLKDVNSTAAKLYNWNILIKALETLQIKIDSDMKALIIAGDRSLISEILKAMYQIETNSDAYSGPLKKKKKNKLLGEGVILLDDLNPNIALTDTESTLEFLIVSFCQVFNLNTKMAAGLLTQSGKVLSQLITKGLKGNIDPVVAWYGKIQETCDYLTDLIYKERSSGSLKIVLNFIKPGLLGKDPKIVQVCCETLVCMNESLGSKDLNAWEWFFSDTLGMAFKSYDLYKEDVTIYILNLLLSYGKDNLKDVFGYLMNNKPDPVQAFKIISTFWGYISEDTQAYDNLQTQGLIDFWVDYGLRQAEYNENNVNSVRLSALGFLCDVWCKFSNYLEKHEDSANCILTVLKRACREKSKIIKIICYGRLFHLLSVFSTTKNTYAPIIYKTLTFALVENYANDRIREFFLSNFLYVMEEIPNLPITVMIEPYIKQGSVINKPRYNTCDFDYFVAIARHPKLTLKDAILAIDALSKVYYNDYVFANSAEIPLILIVGRFINTKPMQEYIIKFINIGLQVIFSKLPTKAINNPNIFTKEESEEKKALSYYKHLVFSLTEKVILLKNNEMNSDIKDCLLNFYIKIKKSNKSPVKSIKVLLNLLGNANSMIESYESSQLDVELVRNNSGVITPKSITEKSDSNKGTVSLSSHPRSRAMSDIERVRKIRKEKESREKTQTEMRRLSDEKQKKRLMQILEQRKILLGLETKSDSSSIIIPMPDNTPIDFPLYPIQDETKQEQDIIWVLINKYKKIFKKLFKHYASSGYKKNKFTKKSFEVVSEGKQYISEGEIVKLLRDHGVTSSFITTEEIKRILAWYLMKHKQNGVDIQGFGPILYYFSSFLYSKGPNSLNSYQAGVCLMMLMNVFKNSKFNVIPADSFDEPYLGTGDKDVIKMLNHRLKTNPDFVLPEGYVKVKEKDVEIQYNVPEFYPRSYVVSLEVLDQIFYKALNLHFLSPSVHIYSFSHAKGTLNKPLLEKEDKIQKLGVPTNKATYKIQPLPAYLNFSPGIKLEVARLTGKYPNDLLLECARVLDDIIYTIENKSFTIISKNPKPAGTIPNKLFQQKIMETQQELSENRKNEAMRKLRKKFVELRLAREKASKENKNKEDQETQLKEAKMQEEKIKKEMEKKILNKINTENKIKEYKLKKKEEEDKKISEQKAIEEKIIEKKKKEREEFLAIAKKKLVENMVEKQQKRQKEQLETELTIKSAAQKKIKQRKLLMKKIQESKLPIQQEKNHKEQVYISMIDAGVKEVISSHTQGIEILYDYFCKQGSSSSTDTSLMYLPGFNKFVTQFPIVPVLISSEGTIKIFKRLTKRSNELGINIKEFIEAMVSISLISINVLERELGKKIESYALLIQEFFNWIGMPKETTKAVDFLKKLNQNSRTLNPRDKIRDKNNLIRNLSES